MEKQKCSVEVIIYYSSINCFWVNVVFKCNKLAVHFKLTLEMVLVVLCKYLNCAADESFDTGYTTVLALLYLQHY